MNRKWLVLLLMMIGTTFTSGCWDKKELNEIAIVSAMGIDKDKEGKLVGTFQIINPGNVAGALQGGGGTNPAISVYRATGNNVLGLDSIASTKISRDMYFAHANLIVIGEEIAKEEGIYAIFDAFERSPEFRATSRIVIARGVKARDIVETLTAIDKVSAEKVIRTIESSEKQQGRSISVNLQEVIKNLVSTGKEPIISGFTVKGNTDKEDKMENTQTSDIEANPTTAGIGVFKDGKLIDWLDGNKAIGSMWVLDRIAHTNLNIDWNDKKDAITYQVKRQKTNVAAKMKNGKPKMLIKVLVEGDIREANVPVNLNSPHVLIDIEKKLAKDLKKEMEDAIVRAQKNKSDIFGFGEIMHESHPKEWKKIEKDWDDVSFAKLEVDVQVETFIRRTGLRNKPYLSNLKKSDQ
ncbi:MULTISPECIES: Ger(x)C family spore germination protein [Peribacillus]|uniref:Ger(X)C family spore germination protein n=1 Tax=Peribacillus butanolivorans TaxID=421767 RepID=A0AAX0S728_9BACI|nr:MULTISPECIES: Ger(x)C family spore germination protein [Peribacillus]KQU24240.1 spore gernimation protein KC [Bacillus sp. Leaf13]KRF67465.1 spore gernimation protein KC [Bacillus sp. Soil768D1]AXN38016.1 Ger(x)C family spore germination protein [Peribacillus butanolivorans]MBK5443111.1 Ger(x)C family spore germination protein [Peribacillus sp. TH24]MBK5462147.1 Ger(x)C family spore germination protein [Peribacillus sp. TH27]